MKSKARKSKYETFPGGNHEKVINVKFKQNKKGTESKIVKRKYDLITNTPNETHNGRSYINATKEVIKYKNGVEVKRKTKKYKDNQRTMVKIMNW